MKIKTKLGIPHYICLVYFVYRTILPMTNGNYSYIFDCFSDDPYLALLYLIDTAAIALIPIGIFFQKKQLAFVGCLLMGIYNLYCLTNILFYSNVIDTYSLLSSLAYTGAIFCAAANCILKKRNPKLLGMITVMLVWLGYLCDTVMRYEIDPEFFALSYKDNFLYSILALIFYVPYFLLGYCFQEPSRKTSELPVLKNFPKVTFSEVISSFVASLIISIPFALVFFFTSTTLGVIAIIIFPIGFTIAYILDKPLREKQEEERRKRQVQLFTMQLENELIHGIKPTNSAPTIDTNRLRNDMMDYYGTAMYSGSPMAQADLVHVQRASDAELIRKAQKSGFDLNRYTQ